MSRLLEGLNRVDRRREGAHSKVRASDLVTRVNPNWNSNPKPDADVRKSRDSHEMSLDQQVATESTSRAADELDRTIETLLA